MKALFLRKFYILEMKWKVMKDSLSSPKTTGPSHFKMYSASRSSEMTYNILSHKFHLGVHTKTNCIQ